MTGPEHRDFTPMQRHALHNARHLLAAEEIALCQSPGEEAWRMLLREALEDLLMEFGDELQEQVTGAPADPPLQVVEDAKDLRPGEETPQGDSHDTA